MDFGDFRTTLWIRSVESFIYVETESAVDWVEVEQEEVSDDETK